MGEESIVLHCEMDRELCDYFIAVQECLDPGAGQLQEQNYAETVNRLASLLPETLLGYGALLDHIAEWEESWGIFGEYGMGEVRDDFYLTLGPCLMCSQYIDGINLESCGGLL